MKERSRKQKFLKNFGLSPNKNSNGNIDEEPDADIVCERLCFYYFDDDAKVTICRGCCKRFTTWLDYRKHFNLSCHTTETNYKLNTYNEVYKKYKLRKAKSKKRINDRLSAAQLMDLETLNTRKTRKRCYTNTRVVHISKSSLSDSGSSNSEKPAKTTIKKEAIENCVSSDDSVDERKQKTKDGKTVQITNIPNSSTTNIPDLPHEDPAVSTIKAEWNADDMSQGSSDDQSSSSVNCLSDYSLQENKTVKYQYVCVICDEQFSSKCLLTMHQVQHIKTDRSSYGVFMAALARSA
ncbi:Hypothetical protein CINCED_3A011210 [Cinara cedri]|uniref:C2H2-type domain-containing protein n=1 Tax=Cinara cedri TaxID=506608 RepID=A0A5E4NKW1_9HEMI|nr:Hypothetical protein CINCED_3A011210 [Cinara cedri]